MQACMQTLTCNSDTATRGTSTYMQDWVDPEVVVDDRSLAGINELHTGTDTGTDTDTHTYTHTLTPSHGGPGPRHNLEVFLIRRVFTTCRFA
jgi:hypothetical protein